tara:strand:- start:3700 stop:5451 length:1752 start_codon:yes stop_codon:yes gene_type:complete
MRSLLAPTCLLGLALLCLGGCRFDPAPLPASWAKDIAKDVASEPLTPLPFRLALAPLSLEFDPDARYQGEAQRYALRPDLRGLRRELRQGFEALGMFQRVAPRGPEGADPKRVAEIAWAENDDLILEIELLDYHQAYIDHVNQGTWWVFYVGAVFPAYWVPVDRYGCQIEAQVRLRGVQGGPPLLEETYLVRADEAGIPQELRPLDREFVGFLDVYALWNVWNSLDESNWRAIERQVAPHAWRRLLLKIFSDLEERVAAPLRDASRREATLRKIRKRFGLIVGVERYLDPRIGSAPHAAEDARRVRELMVAPEGGGLDPKRDLQVLLDGKATKAALLEALETLAERAAPSDEVVIYLAGNGASGIAPVASLSVANLGAGIAPLGSASSAPIESGAPLELPDPGAAPGEGADGVAPLTTTRGVFLTADARSGEPWASGLTLEELGLALRKIRAGRLLLVIDAGFGAPEEGGRTFALATPEGAPLSELSPEAIALALGLEPGRAALLAARPGQTALALPGAQAGLLTYAFDLGARGAADQDADGRVALPELSDYVQREVRGRAGLEGFEQEPLLIGAAPELGWPR